MLEPALACLGTGSRGRGGIDDGAVCGEEGERGAESEGAEGRLGVGDVGEGVVGAGGLEGVNYLLSVQGYGRVKGGLG